MALSKVWVFAEADEDKVTTATLEMLTKAREVGETVEAINTQFHVPKAKLTPGKYTSIVGNTALAYGLMAAARLSGKRLHAVAGEKRLHERAHEPRHRRFHDAVDLRVFRRDEGDQL